MSYESEIKKLEQRWEENPKQFFAPLAEAYRKNGDYEKALELIAEGLGERPNYVSAHIVLGRTRVDMGENDEASRVFEQVLDFDPENIIALNQLAELAEKGGDPEGAVRWLGRLLEVDPMNDEAEQRLKDLRGDDPDLGRTSEPEFPEIPVETLSEPVDGPAGDQPFIDTSFADVMADEPATDDVPETVSDTVVEMEPPVPARRPAIDELETAVNMEAIVGDAPALSDPTSTDDSAADDPSLAEIPTQKMVAIGDESLPVADEQEESLPDSGDPVQVPERDEGVGELTAPAIELPHDASEDESQPEPFVTETMARVYAQQGMIAEAAEVYRKLIELDPADERLADELARLEAETGAEPVAAEASGPRYSVVITGGTSARGMLQGILAATIEPATATAPPREPFATPQQGPSASRLSFDDFYGATGAAPSPEDQGDDPELAGDNDFKSWLKGLKS